MSEVICDRRKKARGKAQVHETVVRPVMMYGLEMALSERQEVELEVAELRMLKILFWNDEDADIFH